jgi:L-ascorbate metabolism protein UlaG (beta-lactamase superfamily)
MANKKRIALAGLGGIVVVLVAGALIGIPSMGTRARGERLARMERSPRFQDGAFANVVHTDMLEPGTFWEMIGHQLFGEEVRVPPNGVPVVTRTGADYATPPATGLRATWIGHASTLIEIDGYRVLVDPIWSERCSPLSFVGPVRFHPPPLPLSELPPIDAVVISHDHYDHLDRDTVVALAARGTAFAVPLGIGAHLEHWGIPAAQIRDLDWYEEANIRDLRLTATPARHYSGRGVTGGDHTLWASWSIAASKHRVFFSGDSGYGAHFAEIGEKLGPFDLTLIKIGASDPTWVQIHMAPEDAVRAHGDVRGRVLLPVHWGTFNLAYHDWNEPPERALAAAKASGAVVVVPRPGEWIEPEALVDIQPWWR